MGQAVCKMRRCQKCFKCIVSSESFISMCWGRFSGWFSNGIIQTKQKARKPVKWFAGFLLNRCGCARRPLDVGSVRMDTVYNRLPVKTNEPATTDVTSPLLEMSCSRRLTQGDFFWNGDHGAVSPQGKRGGKGSHWDVPSRCLCPAGGEHYRGVVGQPGISSHYQWTE